MSSTLTTAQLQALATAINADPTLTAEAAANQFPAIATAFNAAASPTVILWMPNVSTSALLNALLIADMAALTSAQLSYLQMMLSVGTVDATQANIRNNFSSIFTGKTTLTNLTAASQRNATRAEALFTGSSSGGAFVSSLFGYTVTAGDVQAALGK